MDVLRAVCIVAPPLQLAFAVSLGVVGLFTPWWVSPPAVEDGNFLEAEKGTEITLWAHIGCHSNETWDYICGGNLNCSGVSTGSQSSTSFDPLLLGGWRPGELTPQPTYEIVRAPAPTPDPDAPQYPCMTGGISCPQPRPTPAPFVGYFDPSTAEIGKDQKMGDAIAIITQEATYSAENPARYPPTTTAQPTTTTKPPPADARALPTFPPGPVTTTSEPRLFYDPGAMPTELMDEDAKPKIPGTRAPPALPGQDMIKECNENDLHEMSCQLFAGCDKVESVRSSLIAAIAIAALDVIVLLFPVYLCGCIQLRMAPPIGITLGICCSAAFGASVGGAASIEVPHELVGPGAMCAYVALALTISSTLLAAVGIFPLILCPGKVVVDNADDTFPDTSHKLSKDAITSSVGAPPHATKILPPKALADPVTSFQHEKTILPPMLANASWDVNASSELANDAPEEVPATSSVLALAANAEEAAPVSEQAQSSMRRYFNGEGAVYAYAAQAQAAARTAAIHCPECGEELQEFEAEEEGYSCAGCGRWQQIGSILRGCPTCTYDLCTSCSSKAMNGDAERPSTVGYGHELSQAALDDGWEARRSRSSGRFYFVNEKTGESQWSAPGAASAQVDDAASTARSDPFRSTAPAVMYKMKKSRRSGQVYSVRQAW